MSDSFSLFLTLCEMSRTAHYAPQQQGLIIICLGCHSCRRELEACLTCLVSEIFRGQNFDAGRGCNGKTFGSKHATVFCFTIGVAGYCLLNLLSSYPILGQRMGTGSTCRPTLCSLGIPVMSTLVWNFLTILRYKPVVILSGYLCLQAVLTVIAACEESET